jgi:prolyl 4-hydroxylase
VVDDLKTGIAQLRDRARAGDARALTTLGRRLLVGDGVAPAPQEGMACIHRAAAAGDGEATSQLALFAAWGIFRRRNIAEGLDLLRRAAELGWAPAQRELRFLARRDPADRQADWGELRRCVDIATWAQPPAVRVVSESPSIRVCEGFASAGECEWLIALARHGLKRAMIYRRDAAGYVPSDTRTNTEADYLIGNSDIVLKLIEARIGKAVGVETRYFEVAKLLHYEPGQQFRPHCDFQEPTTPALREEVELRGQRVATVLVYLNDDYGGGETDFPRTGFRFKGARGDALLFSNVRPDGSLDYDTLHAGLPPTSGMKWVLSQWIRNKPVSAE